MKQLKGIFVSVLVILAISCKSKNKNAQEELPSEEEVIVESSENTTTEESNFEIEITFKILKDDVFQIFYTSLDAEEAFSPKNSKRKKVLASNDFNSISFQLPEDILPYKLRIDLGENRDQSTIEIKEIKLKYNGNQIKIHKELITQFFGVNEFLKYNATSGVFNCSVVKNRYDPFLISTALLIQKIELEL